MTVATLEVRTLYVSEAVEAKIEGDGEGEHGLDINDVHDAIVGVGRLKFRWHEHPTRGWRALVPTDIDGVPCLVVLYPHRNGGAYDWDLGSAYPV